MCGICGIHSPSTAPAVDTVMHMMGALSHRGPDGSGYFRDETVALGHTRLAIIDPVGGIQPMPNEDGSVWVTFNGEIFNYPELAAQLRAKGHEFRTHSDTEVIVHAWEEWGPGCFDRFNGQWAMGIWDRRSRELVLSRDPYGIQPLYWTRAGDRVLFASEVKALLVDPEVQRRLDPAGLDETLTHWSVVAPRTVFAGISQVAPGSYVVVRDGKVSAEQYWAPSFPPRGEEPRQELAANARELREAIIEATRLRFLRSDVPVSAYLSGGIDSAVIAGVIAEFTDAPLHTFSLRFADDEYDEGRYQRLMSERLGTKHSEITVSGRDLAEVFPAVVRSAEAPLLRTAPAPMFLLSQLVRDSGYKVVVTGEGSDEILAGYDIFREAKVREFWARDPDSSVRARAVELLYPWMARTPNRAPAFAQGFFGRDLDPTDPAFSHRPRWTSTAALAAMLTPEFQAGAGSDVVTRMPAASAAWDPLSRAQWLEITTLLPGYLLASQGDRMLMAHSVEGRFPFLDPHVGRLASEFPARQKMLGLDEKHLLKEAFAHLLPAEIVKRPKQPYRAPDAASFLTADAPDWLAEVTSPEAIRSAGIFAPTIVERLLAKGRRVAGRGLGNTDSMRLVMVLSTQLLHHEFLSGSRPEPPPPPEPLTVFDYVRNDPEEH